MLTRRAVAIGAPTLGLFGGVAAAQDTDLAGGDPLSADALSADAQAEIEPVPPAHTPPPAGAQPPGPSTARYSEDEMVEAASRFFSIGANRVAGAVERVFRENGLPTGYIEGEEGSGALFLGLRYGRGLLYMKNGERASVHWRGPSFGWDIGGNAAKVFTLVYNLTTAGQIFNRFPGVEGSAYVVGGIGVNYQRLDQIILAPMRLGVGLRAGANIGYLKYTPYSGANPF